MAAPGPGRPRETALSVVVPAAESLTLAFRRQHLARTIERKIPAHITLVYPFADADRLDADLTSAVEAVHADVAPFEFDLARIECFDAHVWLAPEPKEPFLHLIRTTYAAFPEFQPYGGAFADSPPTPHLTVGEVDEDLDISTLVAAAECDCAPVCRWHVP